MVFRFCLFLTFVFIIAVSIVAQDVGINTLNPINHLDVRGTSDKDDGGEFQLATPSMTNFLRFFGGRTADPHPFMAFNETDTLHFVTTVPDFSTYNRRMTLYPDGKLGLGTDKPQAELDIRTNAVNDGTELHLSNLDASHFLRLFSGQTANTHPAIYWNFGSVLDFARYDGDLDYRPFMSLDGKTINVLNNKGSVFLGESAGENDDGSCNTAVGSFTILNNIDGVCNTALGYNAGGGTNFGSSFSRNILIGYQAGLNITASDRLYIENSSSTTPLIYGEFDNNLLRINGRQEITGNLNLNQGLGSGVALRVNGHEALWSNGSYFSYGFGTDHNYFAKPMRVGPVEGSTIPYADLHVVDNSGISNLSIESYNNDAILQLSGSTNDANIHWTMRRRNSDGDLEWKHNNLGFMRLTTSGRLGIGLTNPSKTFEVAGDSRIVSSLNGADNYIATIQNTSNNNNFKNNGLEIRAGQDIIGPGGDSRSFYIGFTKPDGTLIGAVGQLDNSKVVYYETSDVRLKKDIVETVIEEETLLKIRVKDYRWNNQGPESAVTTGFIAQELYEVYPLAVRQGGSDPSTDPWQIAPQQLIPLMVKSIQDQHEKIEVLESKNQSLIERIERLEEIVMVKK